MSITFYCPDKGVPVQFANCFVLTFFKIHVPFVAPRTSLGKMVQLLPDLIAYMSIVMHCPLSEIGADCQLMYLTLGGVLWHVDWSLRFTIENFSHPTSCRETGMILPGMLVMVCYYVF